MLQSPTRNAPFSIAQYLRSLAAFLPYPRSALIYWMLAAYRSRIMQLEVSFLATPSWYSQQAQKPSRSLCLHGTRSSFGLSVSHCLITRTGLLRLSMYLQCSSDSQSSAGTKPRNAMRLYLAASTWELAAALVSRHSQRKPDRAMTRGTHRSESRSV
jgi:hypothetical protein